MTRRRWILVAAAAVCLVLASFAAMPARDAGEWGDALRRGDVEAAATDRHAAPSWSVDEIVPFGVARRLLAVDDDLAFRRGVALFRQAHTGIPSFETGLEGRALRVAGRGPARARDPLGPRSEAGGGGREPTRRPRRPRLDPPRGHPTPIERTIFEFQDAIHLDPGIEDAKTNLELVYQLTAPPDTPRGSLRRPGRSHSGASATSPGHGY